MDNENLDYRPQGIGIMMFIIFVVGIVIGICSGLILSTLIWNN